MNNKNLIKAIREKIQDEAGEIERGKDGWLNSFYKGRKQAFEYVLSLLGVGAEENTENKIIEQLSDGTKVTIDPEKTPFEYVWDIDFVEDGKLCSVVSFEDSALDAITELQGNFRNGEYVVRVTRRETDD